MLVQSSYLPEAGALAAVVAACTGRVPVVCGKVRPHGKARLFLFLKHRLWALLVSKTPPLGSSCF